jgi:hypothetical protein
MGRGLMPKPLDLPPEAAKAFVLDMQAYFAEQDPIKRDEIAVLQMHSLKEYWPGKLRLSDVKAMFEQMREHLKR